MSTSGGVAGPVSARRSHPPVGGDLADAEEMREHGDGDMTGKVQQRGSPPRRGPQAERSHALLEATSGEWPPRMVTGEEPTTVLGAPASIGADWRRGSQKHRCQQDELRP